MAASRKTVMPAANRSAERLAGLFVAAGCVLALAAAIVPWYTGSYRLHADILIFALVPYLVYGSLIRTLQGNSLILAGMALLAADILARTVFEVTAGPPSGTGAAILLCLGLLLVVMPAAGFLGRVIDRLRHQSG
jgi:hypothetical protein